MFESIWEMVELQNSLVTDQASNKNQQDTWSELITATIEVTHCNEFLSELGDHQLPVAQVATSAGPNGA
ncbi:MAG: hypothetical protein V3V10_07840 [Planctomycetota bacterium]